MMRTFCLPCGRLLLLLLALLLATAACGGDSDAGDSAAAEDNQGSDARDLFAAKGCAECHGPDGTGTDTAPASLAGTRMIIQQFETRVRNGRGRSMPAHTVDQISDEEIGVLYDWLRNSK